MPPLETAITAKLLDLIRTKRASAEQSATPASGGTKAVRRPAQFSDLEAVSDLKQRHGLGKDSIENWERFWLHNPALREWETPPAMGWVLEEGSNIVGYMGSIPLSYRYGNKTLRAVTTRALVVEQKHRALAVGIVTAFFRQPGVDLFLNTTAVPAAAKLVMALGAVAVAQRDYGKVLFWVLNRKAFTRAVGRKLALNRTGQAIAVALGPAAVFAESSLRRRAPRQGKCDCEVRSLTLEEIGGDFDLLWQSQLEGTKRLLADRGSETLRWHLSGPSTKSSVKLLAAYRGRDLKGYIALLSSSDEETGMRRCLVADLFAADDDAAVTRQLIASAFQSAKAAGDDVLEIIGFPEAIRKVCLAGNPYTREYPACPFYFKTNDGELKVALAAESAWYASPYDGDGSLGH
jgi:hypothetical protein